MPAQRRADLQTALFNAFGPRSGVSLLGDTNNDGTINANDVVVTNFNTNPSSGIVTSADVEMWLHETAVVATGPGLTFNLGLPALPFKVIGTLGGFTVNVGFDYELAFDYSDGTSSGGKISARRDEESSDHSGLARRIS